MIPYIILYAFFVITQLYYAYLCEFYRGRLIVQIIDYKLFIIYSVVLCLFIATRLPSVGTDTETYVRFFHHSRFYYLDMPTDYMFSILGRFFHFFNSSTEWFIFSSGIFIMIGIIYLVNKCAIHKSTSMMFFAIAGTTFLFLDVYLAAMRQACALTFYIISVCLFFKRDRSKTNLICAIVLYVASVLTHASCLFNLPFILFIYYRPITSKKQWVFLIFFTYVLSVLKVSYVNEFLAWIFGYLGESKYDGYVDITFGQIENSGGNPWLNMFILPYSMIALFILYKNSEYNIKNWLIQFILFTAVASNFFSNNLMWGRLLLYLSIFSIVGIPNAIHVKSRIVRIIFYSGFVSYFIWKSYSNLLASMIMSKLLNVNTGVPYASWLFDIFY